MNQDIPELPPGPPSERATPQEIEDWMYQEADRQYALEKERGNDRETQRRQTIPLRKST